MNSGLAGFTKNPADVYRTQQVMSSSPEKLVIMVYDYVISACKARDQKKASRGLAELIDALDFDQGEIAAGLFQLYRHAMERIKASDFEAALSIITELRDTWAEATRSKTA